jgi:hypothetical protein
VKNWSELSTKIRQLLSEIAHELDEAHFQFPIVSAAQLAAAQFLPFLCEPFAFDAPLYKPWMIPDGALRPAHITAANH